MINTKWRWKRKPIWLFPCTRWYPCRLFVLLSKLTSSRWNKHSRLVIKKGTKCFMFHFSIGRAEGMPRRAHLFLELTLDLKMRDLSLSYLPILTSSCSPGACFLFGMEIIGCRLGCLTSTIYRMMSPHGTSTSRNQPKCNHSIYDYMRLIVVCD